MWVQAGFPPDTFYIQTPRHYQLAMQGVRKRLEAESEMRLTLAYETGAFGGLAYHGELKKLQHYKAKSRPQTPKEMLTMLKAMGAKSNMKIERIKLKE